MAQRQSLNKKEYDSSYYWDKFIHITDIMRTAHLHPVEYCKLKEMAWKMMGKYTEKLLKETGEKLQNGK